MRVLFLAVFVLSFSPRVSGAGETGKVTAKECVCPCPSPAPVAEAPSPDSEKCPDEVSIHEFPGGVYGPVDFSHREHAGLADEGCVQCHHHGRPGEILSCDACHKPRQRLVAVPGGRPLPDLQAAFHRQCMGCHLEMESGPLGCAECHTEMKEEKNDKRQPHP